MVHSNAILKRISMYKCKQVGSFGKRRRGRPLVILSGGGTAARHFVILSAGRAAPGILSS